MIGEVCQLLKVGALDVELNIGVALILTYGVYELDEISDGKPTLAQCANANGESYPNVPIPDGQVYDVPGNCVLILRGHRAQVVPLPR